jgi:Uncharacterised nucleotidyltransferase
VDSRVQLSQECRLVFATAAGARRVGSLGGAFDASIDWGRVTRIAGAQKAVASVSRLLASAPGAIRPEVRADLGRQRLISDVHMLHLEERLRTTLAEFEARDVPVLLLKGAAVAVASGHSFTERPMADLDLLVHGSDVARAVEALEDAVWLGETDPARIALYATHHHLPPFRDGRGSGHRAELHTQPFVLPNPFLLSADDFWRDARRAGPESAYAWAHVPSSQHMLLTACIHYAWSHGMRGGLWRTLHDVNTLVEAGIDWDAFTDAARRCRAASSCYWVLRLAQILTGTPVPERSLDALRPPLPARVASVLERHFLAPVVPDEFPPCPSTRLTRLLWRTAIRPGWSGHGKIRPDDNEARWNASAAPREDDRAPENSLQRIASVGRWLGAMSSSAPRLSAAPGSDDS